MKLIVLLALRNIWRQRRRSTLVLSAIVLSIAGVFIMNALARGMEHDFLDSSVGNLLGHLKIIVPGHRDEPGLKHRIPETFAFDVLETPEIAAWTPRMRLPIVIQSERETRGVELVGIDPSLERHSFVKDLEVEGQPLESTDDAFLLLGRELAEELKTSLDRRVVGILTGTDETALEVGFRVRGIFDAPNSGQERAFAFIGLGALQSIVDSRDLTEISVYLVNNEFLTNSKNHLESRLPELSVLTWVEMDPFIGELYGFIGFTIYILIAVFMCTLVFGLINALVTAVLERSREFGLLRAVGMRSNLVVLQVVIECVVLMILGLFVGVVVGLLLYVWLEDGIDLSAYAAGTEAFGMSNLMVPRLHLGDFMVLCIASLLLGLFASYFPARRIIRTTILDSIRNT